MWYKGLNLVNKPFNELNTMLFFILVKVKSLEVTGMVSERFPSCNLAASEIYVADESGEGWLVMSA